MTMAGTGEQPWGGAQRPAQSCSRHQPTRVCHSWQGCCYLAGGNVSAPGQGLSAQPSTVEHETSPATHTAADSARFRTPSNTVVPPHLGEVMHLLDNEARVGPTAGAPPLACSRCVVQRPQSHSGRHRSGAACRGSAATASPSGSFCGVHACRCSQHRCCHACRSLRTGPPPQQLTALCRLRCSSPRPQGSRSTTQQPSGRMCLLAAAISRSQRLQRPCQPGLLMVMGIRQSSSRGGRWSSTRNWRSRGSRCEQGVWQV